MNDDRMDRFARGEIDSAEARALAQHSLDNPELFESLTCTALAKAAVSKRIVSSRPRPRVAVFGAIAAALIVAAAIYSLRSGPRPRLQPALFSVAGAGQPVLLVQHIAPAQNPREVFRSPETHVRAPRPVGSIASLQGRAAIIDLGSLDGLEKGVEMEILRRDQVEGRAIVAAVFRERCRADVISGAARKGDSVRIPPSAHLNALVQFAEQTAAGPDSTAARSIAEKAAEWARSNNLPVNDALLLLGGLEMRAGMMEAAEQHYRAAGSDPEAINAMAVLLVLRGDYDSARRALSGAIGKMPADSIEYARAANNLGVLGELQGDPSDAARWYSQSIKAFPASSPERSGAETNLARIRGSH